MAKRAAVEPGAFAAGVMVTRVSERRAFDQETRSFGAQEVDRDSGLPVWTAHVKSGGDGTSGRYDNLPTVILKLSPGSKLASRPGIRLA